MAPHVHKLISRQLLQLSRLGITVLPHEVLSLLDADTFSRCWVHDFQVSLVLSFSSVLKVFRFSLIASTQVSVLCWLLQAGRYNDKGQLSVYKKSSLGRFVNISPSREMKKKNIEWKEGKSERATEITFNLSEHNSPPPTRHDQQPQLNSSSHEKNVLERALSRSLSRGASDGN